MNKVEVLVVAPHPDDEILGCGGMIIKLIRKNIKVGILYLSSGDRQEKMREYEAREVCNFLSIKNFEFLRLKGKKFTVSPTNISMIQRSLDTFCPRIVYFNHEQDADYEHRIAYQLMSESVWRYNASKESHNRIQAQILYEVHKPMASYNLVEDVSSEINKKIEALKLYKSQLNYSRLDLAISGLNQYRGILHENADFAEVFQIKRLNSITPYLK